MIDPRDIERMRERALTAAIVSAPRFVIDLLGLSGTIVSQRGGQVMLMVTGCSGAIAEGPANDPGDAGQPDAVASMHRHLNSIGLKPRRRQ